jgi:tryptophan synthase alpha chain
VTVARIEARFADLERQGRAAFVSYVMAGDPDLETSWAILEGLPAAGADLIELGFPFSDPMAEGPPIQRAALRALKAGVNLKGVLALAGRFRATDAATPVVLMGYLNPLLSYGLVAFARDAAAAGIDGVIVVDCPPEESGPLNAELAAEGLAVIRLVAPTTDDARLPLVLDGARGFIYCVSVAGVTGGKEADATVVAAAVTRVRRLTSLPVGVGFGIRTPARAAEVARVCDAAVVGSALVDEIAEAIAHNRDPAVNVLETAARLAKAVRSARAAE